MEHRCRMMYAGVPFFLRFRGGGQSCSIFLGSTVHLTLHGDAKYVVFGIFPFMPYWALFKVLATWDPQQPLLRCAMGKAPHKRLMHW